MRRLPTPLLPLTTLGLASIFVPACGGGTGDDTSSSKGTSTGHHATGSGGQGGSGSGTGGEGGTGGGNIVITTGTGGSATGSTSSGDACFGVQCDPDKHCDSSSGQCVNNTCADLQCTATETCQTTAGGGAVCKDISCSTDAACPVSQYCNGTICVDDVCTPGARTCVGQDLHECSPNGGGDTVKFTCGSQAYFTSTCTDAGAGAATCPCQDDWDCPANTSCEAGVCTGTGKAPTCTLPPAAFSAVPPVQEIRWGGTDQSHRPAVGSPFAMSSQVSSTPLVINLDDDNGDGLINELDFPEIVFMTYCGTDVSADGVIRAIHGGGPNKGKDMWANAGTAVWHEGDPIVDLPTCNGSSGTGNSTSVLAAGDLDGDGIPEIVFVNESSGVTILDNKGNLVATSANNLLPAAYSVPAVTLANLDNTGLAEIIVGAQVFTLDHDASGKIIFVDHFAGAIEQGKNSQGPVSCVANLVGDAGLEVVAGSTVYRLPAPPAGVKTRAGCVANDASNFCKGVLDVVWDGQTVNGATKLPTAQRDGFCAIADVLGLDQTVAPGPQNPLDGKPEVVLISNGYLVILNGQDGTLRRFINLNAGSDGGAPNIDDFDGDGFPEVGTAFGAQYVMYDLQDSTTGAGSACQAWPNVIDDNVTGMQGNPARTPGGACTANTDCATGAVCGTAGKCVCLNNGWRRKTEDDSSSVTGSSVFDFNGDGAAEVIYNDECYFRIYDGTTGDVLFKHHSPSRTRIEYPVVADVDNDGNAEIIFASNNDTSSCSEGANYPNGIQVFGDPTDTWVSARRVWNEHAYHVTNVLESGAIPTQEPESWKTYNGRKYNTYRSNPRSSGVAPDLTLKGVQVSSPDATCGQLSKKIDITVEVDNIGDLRVGPGVVLSFYGTWASGEVPLGADSVGTALTSTLTTSIEPGGSLLVTVSYDSANNTPMALPTSIRVVVDSSNQERECVESNNEISAPVNAGTPRADLRITLTDPNTAGCPNPTLTATVFNDGSAPASNVVVRFYAGDPNQGGTAFHEETIPGPIAAGTSTGITPTLTGFPPNLPIVVYAVVDPDNLIAECNDGNNKASASKAVSCTSIN